MSNTLFGEIIELGVDGQPIVPNIVLAYRSGEKIGVIQNVTSFVDSNHLMSAPEVSFDVHKHVDNIECEYWDDIKDFKMVYIPHLGHNRFNPWYEIKVTIDENDETVKHIEGIHAQEAELSQLMLYDIQINTEDDIARDDYEPSIIYNSNNADASILDRILHDKATHYTISYVSPSLASLQRTFEFDNESIEEAFQEIGEEIEGLFIYGLSTTDDGQIHRTISLYDLNDVCLDCGERGVFTNGVCTACGSTNITEGFGDESGVFLNRENFTQNINYSSNKDEVKNCFRLEAGDDLMTATVRNINPNGSQYIWYLSDEIRSDMSDSLRSRLASYDTLYAQYETTQQMTLPSSAVDYYNSLVQKYNALGGSFETFEYPIIGYSTLTDLYYQALNLHSHLQTTLAPASAHGEPTTAAEQAARLTSESLSPIGIANLSSVSEATVNNAVLSYAKVYIDTSVYKMTIASSSYSNFIWTGQINLTSYVDDTDTANTATLSIVVTSTSTDYVRCMIEKAMKKTGEDATGTVALFKLSETDFKNQLSYYSVDNLNILASVARACIDVMISQGIATPNSASWGEMYTSMYLPYYNKRGWIEDELIERESEVHLLRNATTQTGLLDYIEKRRQEVADALDLRAYLGETLWAEFCSFRRDDSYENRNFISDGLSDEELITSAQEFIENAKREIIKAGTIQHTISCNLYDLLLVDEKKIQYSDDYMNTVDGVRIVTGNGVFLVRMNTALSEIIYNFKLGNWLHIEVDDNIYKLRMTDYTINYDDLTTIDVDFSDVAFRGDSASDLNSLLSKAQSLATSYPSTVRQANKGSLANQMILNMVSNGLDLTNKKIVNNAANQNMVVDDSGLLMRAQNEFDDDYNAEQVKIINHGLYYTNDNWMTVQTGLGKFIYYDPEDMEYKEDYGLIAHKIVGNIILGNDLGIYNESGSLKMDENGVTITSTAVDNNPDLFTIQKDNGDGTYTKYVYLDEEGNLIISGNTIELSSTSVETFIDNKIGNIKIGSNNFLRHADSLDGCNQHTSAYTTTEDAIDNIDTVKATLNSAVADRALFYEIYTDHLDSLAEGDELTVSMNVYSSCDQTVTAVVAAEDGTNAVTDTISLDLTTGWNYIYGVMIYSGGTTNINTHNDDTLIEDSSELLMAVPYVLRIVDSMAVNDYLAFDYIQLEKGNVPTDFHIAAEDTDEKYADLLGEYATTVEMRAAINIESDEIKSTVSKTYSTKNDVNVLATEVSQTAEAITSKIINGDETTMMRVYLDGVLLGKVNQPVCALVNADGSFDIVGVTWSNATPTITATYASFGNESTIGGNAPVTEGDVNEIVSGALERMRSLYGVCTTSASAATKRVTLDGFDELYDGAVVHIYFDHSNSVDYPYLKINDLDSKPIYVNGQLITEDFSPWAQSETVTFVYDGTYQRWNLVGQMNVNADNIKAGTLNGIVVNAAEGSNLAGWITQRDDDSTGSMRSPWVWPSGEEYKYQVALKSTPNSAYGSIFVKRQKVDPVTGEAILDTYGNPIEDYPFYVKADGSMYSTNPILQWPYGDETNYAQLRQGGESGARTVSLSRYINGELYRGYDLLSESGEMAPSLGITAWAGTRENDHCFTFGSMVFINFRIVTNGAIPMNSATTIAAINHSDYYPNYRVTLHTMAFYSNTIATPINTYIEPAGTTEERQITDEQGNPTTVTVDMSGCIRVVSQISALPEGSVIDVMGFYTTEDI